MGLAANTQRGYHFFHRLLVHPIFGSQRGETSMVISISSIVYMSERDDVQRLIHADSAGLTESELRSTPPPFFMLGYRVH